LLSENHEGENMSMNLTVPRSGGENTTDIVVVLVEELCREREVCGHLIRQLLAVIALPQNHHATVGQLHSELGEYFAGWARDAGVAIGKPTEDVAS
jgi:hypothetical protein